MDSSNPSHSKRKRLVGSDKETANPKNTYFISLAIKDDMDPLATVRGKSTVLNERGRKLLICWRELGLVRSGILPDSALVTERHFQGILMLSASGSEAATLAEAIRLFKVLSSLGLAQLGKSKSTPAPLWKKGYSERVVIGKGELAKVRRIFSSLSVKL